MSCCSKCKAELADSKTICYLCFIEYYENTNNPSEEYKQEVARKIKASAYRD